MESLIAAGRVLGWAWADGGIDAVDVGADGASSWMRAIVERSTGRAWQRFSATLRPAHCGAHELCSRAQSTDARSQDRERAMPFIGFPSRSCDTLRLR